MKKTELSFIIIILAISLTACRYAQAGGNAGTGKGRTENARTEEERTKKAGREDARTEDARTEESQARETAGLALIPPREAKTDSPAGESGVPGTQTAETPGEKAARALEQELIKGRTFQVGSDTIGAKYGEIYCFLEDHRFFWFAGEGGDRWESTDRSRTVFRAGTWAVTPAEPYGEVKQEDYTELLVTLRARDVEEGGRPFRDPTTGGWLLEGAELKRDAIVTNEEYDEISKWEDTIYIAGDPVYPVSIPLTDSVETWSWLERYAALDPDRVAGGRISIGYALEQAPKGSQTEKDPARGSSKAMDDSALMGYRYGEKKYLGMVDGKKFSQSQIYGEGFCTAVYYEEDQTAKMAADLVEVWDFTMIEGTEKYPYVLFTGRRVLEDGWSQYGSSLFVYVKETGAFGKGPEGVCSTSVGLMVNKEEGQADAWLLYHGPAGRTGGTGDLLLPFNLNTGEFAYDRGFDTGMNLMGDTGEEGKYQYAMTKVWPGSPTRLVEIWHAVVDVKTGETAGESWYLDTGSVPMQLEQR